MRSAFSLVELSIVLVILGLLTGGILTGQSLIRAAELRAVTTEFSSYQTSINTFKSKYFQLPGDFSQATDFWSAANADPATCATTASTGTETCNGNANGRLDHDAAGSNEWYRFWQHLANAGLVEGRFSGVEGGGGDHRDVIIGVNIPSSRLGSAGWMARYGDGGGGTTGFDNPTEFSGNFLRFGADSATANDANIAPVLTPEEAWSIDTKIDDAAPAHGRVVSQVFANCTTAADKDELNATYNLTNSNQVCSIMFPRAF